MVKSLSSFLLFTDVEIEDAFEDDALPEMIESIEADHDKAEAENDGSYLICSLFLCPSTVVFLVVHVFLQETRIRP